jgi:cell division protein FtsL
VLAQSYHESNIKGKKNFFKEEEEEESKRRRRRRRRESRSKEKNLYKSIYFLKQIVISVIISVYTAEFEKGEFISLTP